MKSALLIGIAAFTIGCGGSRQSPADTSANATGSGSVGSNPSAAPASERSSGTVTLVGCLQGPHLSRTPGTSATAATDQVIAPTAGNDAHERQRHGAADVGPFVLTNATDIAQAHCLDLASH